MESPITHKEFDNWETYGSSLFQKGRIIVVPEVADTRGAIVSKKFTNHRDSWIADIKVRIGNDNQSLKGGNGVGIYYLRDIDQSEVATGLFGYTKNFNGLGIVMNTILQKSDGDKYANFI